MKQTKPEIGDARRLAFLLRLSWSALNRAGKLTVVAGILVVLLTAYAVTLIPLLFSKFIDEFSSGADFSSTAVALMVGFMLTYWLAHLGREVVWITAGPVQQRIQRFANASFFANALALPYDYHLKKSTGALNEKLVQAQNGMNQIIFSALTDLFPTIAQTLFVLVNSLIFLPFYVAIFLGVTIGIYLTVLVYGAERIRQQQRAAQKELIGARGLLTDAFLGVEAIKAFGQEQEIARRYDERLGNAESRFLRFLRIRFVLGASQVTIASVGMALALGVSVYQVHAGALTVGALVLIQMYFVQTINPLQGLSLQYRNIKSGLTMVDGIGELFDWSLPTAKLDEETARLCNGASLESPALIFLDKVSVSRNGRVLVENIDLSVSPSEVIAIVGPTGAGKSTLVRLLLRLLEPDTGEMSMGGVSAAKVKPEDWRKHIALIPQDIVLFNDTLQANLQFGAAGATSDDIENVVEMCRLTNLVKRAPNGLQTVVGERGQLLSGGERQRVGLARAVLRSPEVYILDEATSALDKNTETEVLGDLLRLDPQATKIIVTHRLNTIEKADRIYVVDQGRIVQCGRHDELLQIDGLYKTLSEAQ